mgnify:CR=1 FL=1
MKFNKAFKLTETGTLTAREPQPVNPRDLDKAGRKKYAQAMIARAKKMYADKEGA